MCMYFCYRMFAIFFIFLQIAVPMAAILHAYACRRIAFSYFSRLCQFPFFLIFRTPPIRAMFENKSRTAAKNARKCVQP